MLKELIRHVELLAGDIGERNPFWYKNLEEAGRYIKETLESIGYSVQEQIYLIEDRPYRNFIATQLGISQKDKIILICSHYDSASGSPGADDNASGVAGMLELARLISRNRFSKTIRFVATTLEEPPWFETEYMGSFRYAQQAKKEKENIEAVICLESIGFYSDKKNSQNYPFGLKPFYPKKANFIAFVSNLGSGSLLKKMVKNFRKTSDFPLAYLMAPPFLVPAIGFSDNISFWKFGYQSIMITDTAFYRNPFYHTDQDTSEKLDYQCLAKLTEGLYYALKGLDQ